MTIRTVALLLLVGCAAQAAPKPPVASDRATRSLEGRIAGGELACVSTHDLRGSRPLADGSGILFEGRGDLIYLNMPRGGCPGVSEDVALSTSTPAGRLCAGDAVQAFDRASGVSHGACRLGPFTPYRRGR